MSSTSEPDPVLHLTQAPAGDPYFISEWAYNNTGQPANGVSGTAGADISALSAWDISTGSRSIVVGDIDTGIDWENDSDLQANIWEAPSAFTLNIGGYQFNCPQGDYGFNSVDNQMGCSSNTMVEDTYGHGTHTAGVIGATGVGGTTGVNWNVSIIPLKAGDNGSFGSDVVSAIEAAVQIKQRFGAQADIRALNMSYADSPGSDPSQSEIDEMNRAAQNGIISVAGTGDDCVGYAQYPAGYDLSGEIAVGASDQNDQLANWGNGKCSSLGYQIVAPGSNIYTTDLNGGYTWFNGVSASVPFVTGAAALVSSACYLPDDQLISDILGNSDQIAIGKRLNLYKALWSCTTGTPGTATVWISGDTCGSCGGYPNIPDSGTLTLNIGGSYSYSITYSAGGLTADDLASTLAGDINNDGTSPVTATVSGSQVLLTSKAKGPYTNFSISTGVVDTCTPPPGGQCLTGGSSYGISASNFTAGSN